MIKCIKLGYRRVHNKISFIFIFFLLFFGGTVLYQISTLIWAGQLLLVMVRWTGLLSQPKKEPHSGHCLSPWPAGGILCAYSYCSPKGRWWPATIFESASPIELWLSATVHPATVIKAGKTGSQVHAYNPSYLRG
jgi:hypothetical protein